MKKIAYEGIGAVVATFALEESLAPGTVVEMVSSGTVETASEGAVFLGSVFDCEKPFVAVQVKGFMTCRATGVVPVGQVSLVGDGTGGVKVGSNGVSCTVVSNWDNGFVTFCL